MPKQLSKAPVSSTRAPSGLDATRLFLGRACSARLRQLRALEAKLSLGAATGELKNFPAWGDALLAAWSSPQSLEPLERSLELPGAASVSLGPEGCAFERLFNGGDMVGGWLALAQWSEQDLRCVLTQGPLGMAWEAARRGAGLGRISRIDPLRRAAIQEQTLRVALAGAKLAKLAPEVAALVVWETKAIVGFEPDAPRKNPWFGVETEARMVEDSPELLSLLGGVESMFEAQALEAAAVGVSGRQELARKRARL
jgi:hypothetical protein